MASHIQDDGFHEIQLNGKQLVFLFMAVTVASVVIFLCGVLVGRGVRAERAGALAEAMAVSPAITPEGARPQSSSAPAGSDPRSAAPPPTGDLSYSERLGEKEATPERLKPASDKVTSSAAVPPPAEKTARNSASAEKVARKTSEAAPPAPPVVAPAATHAAAKPVAAASVDASPGEPSGQGFALQITALREPGEAAAIARRLSAKGYAAYILKPPAGTPPVYRVRVGKFKTRREAEAIATKLHKEEQFSPWITR